MTVSNALTAGGPLTPPPPLPPAKGKGGEDGRHRHSRKPPPPVGGGGWGRGSGPRSLHRKPPFPHKGKGGWGDGGRPPPPRPESSGCLPQTWARALPAAARCRAAARAAGRSGSNGRPEAARRIGRGQGDAGRRRAP